MAVTRIKNNQVTDASGANTQVGINANAKLQNYSITAGKLANNLTYGSDLTITGNLTVQGNSTAIDTTITTIEDPVIVLASTQTSGAPAVDIGFLGFRGNESNIAFVWDESADEFVTAFTSTAETNSTITITSFADFHTNNANIGGNIVINGTTSMVGNVVGATSFTGNVTAGNVLTPGLVSATGNVTGGNVNTAGAVSATANITGGNVLTGGLISATSTITSAANITGGNLLTGGVVSATGNIIANPSSFFIGNGSQLTGVAASSANFPVSNGTSNINAAVNANITVGVSGTSNVAVFAPTGVFVTGVNSVSGNITGGNLLTAGLISSTGTITSAANITGGNLLTAGLISATGTITSASNITGANIVTAGQVTATGNVTGGNVNTAGVVTATGNITGGNILTGGLISATSTITSAANITGANIVTAGQVTATGNITGGNILTPGLISAAGLATSGNVQTAGFVSAAGNVYADNVITDNVISSGALSITTGANADINIQPNGTGNIVLANTYVNSVRYPVQDQDAASKIYVDNLVTTAISYHEAVVVATTTTLASTTGGTITYNQPNGASNGIGATLTTTGSFNLIDTANVQSANTRILVKNEANAAHNGIYVWSNATVITRSSDGDTAGVGNAFALGLNDYFFTTGGNVNKGTAFIIDEPTTAIVFGTSNIGFAIFSQSQVYSANTSAGLVLNGTEFSAKVDNNTTAFDGGGNIIVKAGANLTTPNIGAATGTSLSLTGNVTSGNVITGGFVTATGNVTGGNVTTAGLITATGNVTGGNLVTGGLVTATGNVTGGNVLTAGVVSATANVTGGNLLTVGLISATSTITSASNITGANITTAGLVTATGNITGGNLLTGGLISATGVVTSGGFTTTGNVTGGNILFGSGIVSGTGNVYAANFFGNIAGNIDAAGANTEVQFNDTGDILGASAGFTFNKVGNILTANGNINGANLFTGGSVSATANITGGNILTGGLISATSTITSAANVTGGNITTAGLVTATGNVTGGNITTAGQITATGNITGANLILTTGTINGPAAGRITINGSDIDTDFAVDGDTLANVFYVDAGTGTASFGSSTQTTNAIVAFNATTSILTPVGNTAQRPGTGVTGMLRFNSTSNSLEIYDNSQWSSVGVPSFTVIDDEQFAGDGSTVAFTLGSTQTTNSCIVSINGVVQIPTLAYSVAGTDPTCVLTFTEAPASGDVIDVRQITTTTTVISISNSPGNAVVGVNPTVGNVEITGNIMPTANATANIGSASFQYNTIFAKATSAQYADLAEKYTADADYAPGTVVSFGGTKEVTITTVASDTRVAGVISTNPSYRMNDGLQSAHTAMVALTGRVPTSVTGTVCKGDLMVSAGNGVAMASSAPAIGTVIGKALADSEGDAVIEVVVGRV